LTLKQAAQKNATARGADPFDVEGERPCVHKLKALFSFVVVLATRVLIAGASLICLD
jgi:hypothetical protein